MREKTKNFDLVEVKSIKNYSSVILTSKEFRKGRKRWKKRYGS